MGERPRHFISHLGAERAVCGEHLPREWSTYPGEVTCPACQAAGPELAGPAGQRWREWLGERPG